MQPKSPCPIYFLAPHPRWQTAVERFRSSAKTWIGIEVKDFDEIVRAIEATPNSFSVIEIGRADALQWIRRIGLLNQISSQHRLVVVGSGELRPFVGAFREAGALFCAFTLTEAHRVAALIERFARKFTPKPLPLREAVISALPWTNAATMDRPHAGNLSESPTSDSTPPTKSD